jgi:hypothetical protein
VILETHFCRQGHLRCFSFWILMLSMVCFFCILKRTSNHAHALQWVKNCSPCCCLPGHHVDFVTLRPNHCTYHLQSSHHLCNSPTSPTSPSHRYTLTWHHHLHLSNLTVKYAPTWTGNNRKLKPWSRCGCKGPEDALLLDTNVLYTDVTMSSSSGVSSQTTKAGGQF